jgi:hypothetical protein
VTFTIESLLVPGLPPGKLHSLLVFVPPHDKSVNLTVPNPQRIFVKYGVISGLAGQSVAITVSVPVAKRLFGFQRLFLPPALELRAASILKACCLVKMLRQSPWE